MAEDEVPEPMMVLPDVELVFLAYNKAGSSSIEAALAYERSRLYEGYARLAHPLLRSPLLAHHDPEPPDAAPHGVFADRGDHLFRLRLLWGEDLAPEGLEAHAATIHSPPLVTVTTRGMKP